MGDPWCIHSDARILLLLDAIGRSSPFVGTWKLNADESKLTGQEEKIEDLGGNKYRFSFGLQDELARRLGNHVVYDRH